PVLTAEPSRADALAVKEAIGAQKRVAAPVVERRRERAPDSTPARSAPDVQSVLEAYLAGDIGAAIERAQASKRPPGERMRAAVQDDPSNDAASSQLRQIADRAKDIYLRGYVAKDDDAESARKAFKLVIETLPASDETAQKAKRWLDKLDGKVSKEE